VTHRCVWNQNGVNLETEAALMISNKSLQIESAVQDIRGFDKR